MADHPRASRITFTPATSGLRATGLFGWVSLRYGGLDLDGITVRRTLDGRHVISFPEGRRRSGRSQEPVRPSGQDVRQELEADVLGELRLMGAIP